MPIGQICKTLGKVSLSDKSLYSRVICSFLNIKSKSVYKRIKPYIVGKRMLDIGTGVGGIAAYLKSLGFDITCIDVADLSVVKEIPVIIFDGDTIPFSDNSFDTAIIIHVLHHCADGVKILKEASRVAKRVILIEDTYRNDIEKAIVSINDMFGNFEFYSHPYHTTLWWKGRLNELGFNVIHCEEYSEMLYNMLYGRYVLFVLEKN